MSVDTTRIDETIQSLQTVVKRVSATIRHDRGMAIGSGIIFGFIFLGVFGPDLAPYDPIQEYVRQGGTTLRLSPPTVKAPFGTTQYGRDVFSQFIAGAQPTMIAGLGGFVAGIVGFLVGLLAGYFGGWVDEVLMRITDYHFALPAFPLALVVLDFLDPRIWMIFLLIVLLTWKLSARVVRSETITVKERTFVKATKASGAGHTRLLFLTIAPNVLPIGLLYSTYSMALAISFEAGLAFLGFGDPTTTSWGQMIRAVYSSGTMREAWWWLAPPVIGIAVITVTVFLVGRKYEELINPELRT